MSSLPIVRGEVGQGGYPPAQHTYLGAYDDPANTLGIRRIMFAIDDIEDVPARLHTHDLIGEVEQ